MTVQGWGLAWNGDACHGDLLFLRSAATLASPGENFHIFLGGEPPLPKLSLYGLGGTDLTLRPGARGPGLSSPTYPSLDHREWFRDGLVSEFGPMRVRHPAEVVSHWFCRVS